MGAVVVSGASGLVGTRLARELARRGRRVRRLVRREPTGPDEIDWRQNPSPAELAGAAAVVHLAGENIASGRWTDARKRRIVESRVAGTRSIVESVRAASPPPRVWVQASAIGYYGDRGDERLDESSPPGSGFLADTCRAWEEASSDLPDATRSVVLRLGLVLSSEGGALARMLPVFRLGLGGRLGPGTQFMSWIRLDDLIDVIVRAIDDSTFSGAINAVAPEPVRNLEFTRTLAATLGRPAIFAVPRVAISLALGEMGRELLLTSARVVPRRLADLGHRCATPDLAGALARELGLSANLG